MIDAAQGEVWMADLEDNFGRRPVLVLTRNNIVSRLDNVTVAPFTTTIRGIQSEVLFDERDGLPRRCVVSLDNIMTIPKQWLVHGVAAVPYERMYDVWQAVRHAFDMPD